MTFEGAQYKRLRQLAGKILLPCLKLSFPATKHSLLIIHITPILIRLYIKPR